MSNCPSCSRKIKIDESHYGTLYTCPHCQNVFFVGWDGQPENAAASGGDGPGTSALSPEFSPGEEAIPQANDFISTGSPSVDTGDPLNPLEQSSQENSFSPETSFEPTPSFEPLTSFDPQTAEKENFSDVLEFANAIEDKGLITYTLTIRGIDLSHLHQQLTDALTDPKFNWQVADVIAQIQNGTLILESLNAAKASVLVQRLKFLPLEIHWRQNVLTS